MKIPWRKKPEPPKQVPASPIKPMRLSEAVKQQQQKKSFFAAVLGPKPAQPKAAQEPSEIDAKAPFVAKVSAISQFTAPFKEEARIEILWLMRKLGFDTTGYEDAATKAYREMRGWK